MREGTDPATRVHSYKEVALWLITCERLSKNKIGDYLGRSDDDAVAVLDAFVEIINFVPFTFDEAMRFFLSLFRLPGEAQQIARIMEKFASAYATTHPATFSSADTAYVLAYSLIMLNVDAHNDQIVNKMTNEQFISNNRGIGENGADLPPQLLSALYKSIVDNEIRIEQRDFISAVKEGWLFKQGGRVKTWKKRYVILSGNVLYYFKSPKDKEPLGFVPLENIEVHLPKDPKSPNFALVPSRGALMKSVRAAGKSSSFVHGHHKMFNFKADSVETMKKWVQSVKDHAVKLEPVQSMAAPSRDHRKSSTARKPEDPAFIGSQV